VFARRANQFVLSEVIGDYVKLYREKYISSVLQKHVIISAHPAPLQEGRFAVVTSVGRGMRWTRWLRWTSGAGADG
jgi:hypothetical protein